jgi:hypothetical protein
MSPVTIQRTSDKGYVVAGWTYSFGARDKLGILVMKLNEGGGVAWQNAYVGGYPNSIQQASDGGYILLGTTSAFTAGGYDLWVLKLGEKGEVRWQKTYGGTGDDRGASVHLTLDGGYVVAGSTKSFGPGGRDQTSTSIWVLKLDPNGSVQWQKAYDHGDDSWNAVRSFRPTSDGGFILNGLTVAIKLDNIGNLEWQRSYRNGSCLGSIQQTKDQGYILARGDGCCGGCSGVGSGFFVLKLDSRGEISDCPLVEPANVLVTETDVVGSDTNVPGVGTDLAPRTGDVTATDLHLSQYTLCSYPSNPDIQIDPQEMIFQAVLPGESTQKAITITNMGTQTVTIERITSPSNPLFTIIGDNCSGKALVADGSCTVNLNFSPAVAGHYEGVITIIVNDSYKSIFTAFLYGGTYLTLLAPSNGVVFDACSLASPPTFSWDAAEDFERYEVSFYGSQSGKGSFKVRVPGEVREVTLKTNLWKKVMQLPETIDGKINWAAYGIRHDRSVELSEWRHFYIANLQPTGNPTISPTSKSDQPALSWQNNCNAKFKVWFGSDEIFSKKTTYTFPIKNPNDNGGNFLKTLTPSQWKSIRRLIGEQSGSPIYWYIESWDELGRYTRTDVMGFVLTD